MTDLPARDPQLATALMDLVAITARLHTVLFGLGRWDVARRDKQWQEVRDEADHLAIAVAELCRHLDAQ